MRFKPTFPVTFSRNDVLSFEKIVKYKGFFTLSEYRFQHRLFNGQVSDIVSREVLERGHAVILLAYDHQQDKVVLIEQIRIGAIESNDTPWLLEMIAGMLDHEGENEEQVARREAQEEAGITIGRCEQVLSYLASPGGMTERLTVFIGEVDANTAQGIHGVSDEHEDIRVHVVERQVAYQWLCEGKINNAGAIIALQWLQLNYRDLQTRWQKYKK